MLFKCGKEIRRKLMMLAVIVTGSVASQVVVGAIIYNGDFETGYIKPNSSDTNNGFYYGAFGPNCMFSPKNYSDDNDNRVQTKYVRKGSYANAQTIKYHCDYGVFNGGPQKPRQELSIYKALPMKENRAYWIGFSFMLDKSWVSDYSNNPDNLFQLFKEKTGSWNARADGANAVNIKEVNGKFTATFRNSYDSNGNAKQFSWPTVKNKWQDVAFNIKFCRKNTANCNGFIRMYLNGNPAPVFSHNGPNTEADAHKLMINLYKYNWICQDASNKTKKQCLDNRAATRSKANRTVYFDELKVGNSSSSLREVSPGGMAPPPPPTSEDPVPNMTCSKADSAITNGIAAGWYKHDVADKSKWEYKITTKNGYCLSDSWKSEPFPSLTCQKAKSAIQKGLTNGWYRHNITDSSDWNHRITVKNAYCFAN
ncbi:heparin lyase I family protein [Ketobacter nezhaii]|uniref:heparin lyase I family protein n=1 Tax=Ketobacter sp. MCCC 1A13808 TaxID=2602738 RepID=UPI0018DE30C7|nr:heparin lyase I family protein [Ketobacter sp. MCCC 1A13808]